jgi:hypothetical protein
MACIPRRLRPRLRLIAGRDPESAASVMHVYIPWGNGSVGHDDVAMAGWRLVREVGLRP